ncbi:MAG: hypothetical protein HN601_01625 [Candidatus Marinimicrobia bacterium]|jgi:hypothetical protein|nr:hypothetical protein [Candidatus Neomarinimicrobiota bacterium]
MGFFGGNNRNKIIEIIKSTDKKTIDKRESQNIDDIVFIDDLQIFFGGGGEKFEDKSGMGLSGKIYTIGFDEIFGGTNPGSSPIEFLFWALPDFEKADKNDPFAFMKTWELPKTGKYDVALTFYAAEGDILGIHSKQKNKFTYFTAEVVKKIKSYYLLRCMENREDSIVDRYIFLLSEDILNSFIKTYLLNYPEDIKKFKSVEPLDISDLNNFNILNKQHLFKRNQNSD